MKTRVLIVVAAASLAVTGVASYQGVSARQASSVWQGVYTTEQAERGEQLYRSWCAECHGEGLEGGETAPALVGSEFMWAWDGLSVADLFERIRISMPENAPSAVTRSEKADVLAYMFSINKLPDGNEELEDRAMALRSISFEAEQP